VLKRGLRIGILAAITTVAATLSMTTPANAWYGNIYSDTWWDGCGSMFVSAESNYAGDSWDWEGFGGCPGVNDSVSSASNASSFQDFNLWSDSWWRGTAYDIPTSTSRASLGSFDNRASSHEW
jgi:hypothetical protein